MSFSIKKIFYQKGVNLYHFYENNMHIGTFIIDESQEDIVLLKEFEILENFQGKGYAKEMGRLVKLVLDTEYEDRIVEIHIVPYGSQRLDKDSLLDFYKSIFKGSMEVGYYKLHYMN